MAYRKQWLAAGLLLAAGTLGGGRSEARWMRTTEPVPVERLVKNVTAYVAEHPKEARGYYVLGRLHSMAFAETGDTVEVVPAGTQRPGADPSLPGFAGYQPIQVVRERDRPLTPEAIEHLQASVRNYRSASVLAPNEALYFLGLGWMLEQGLDRASEAGRAPGETDRVLPLEQRKRLWRDKALAAYRRAYALAVSADRKKTGLGPATDGAISLEAGEGILRIFAGRTLSTGEKAEAARLRATVRELKAKPRAVTPILFPLHGTAPLSDLLAPERTVVFDLAGDGRAERWPWVGPDTGILVWDPQATGRVRSGRQLFGSSTWWIFWRDGYAALAALDDDRDGLLAGDELNGLAVWRDRNTNGISDEGEVMSAHAAGIAAIAGRATGKSADVPANGRGVRWTDGTFSPTYDWTPTALPTNHGK